MINSIIEAISVSLNGEFGDDYEIHMEEIKQGLKEPCFFIACLNPTNNLFMGKRYERTNQSASNTSQSLMKCSGNVTVWLKECMTVWSTSQQTVI
jgi:hypothetical protein